MQLQGEPSFGAHKSDAFISEEWMGRGFGGCATRVTRVHVPPKSWCGPCLSGSEGRGGRVRSPCSCCYKYKHQCEEEENDSYS